MAGRPRRRARLNASKRGRWYHVAARDRRGTVSEAVFPSAELWPLTEERLRVYLEVEPADVVDVTIRLLPRDFDPYTESEPRWR